MKTKMVGILGVLLLVAALVVGLAGVVLAQEENSTKWELDSETVFTGYEMERDGGPGDNGQTGSVIITANGNEIWFADEAATTDLGFATASWSVILARTGTITSTHDITVRIGVYDGSSYTWKEYSGTKTFPAGNNWCSFSFTTSAFTVPNGDRIVFQIEDQENATLEVVTNAASNVTFPLADPVYPVPELPTILLSGAGLAALGGYIWLRRRRQHKVIFSG